MLKKCKIKFKAILLSNSMRNIFLWILWNFDEKYLRIKLYKPMALVSSYQKRNKHLFQNMQIYAEIQ